MAVVNRMKKSATITLTLAAAFGASAQAQTVPPPCDPNAPASQNAAGCRPVKGSHGLAAILHKGFGSTGAGTAGGS